MSTELIVSRSPQAPATVVAETPAVTGRDVGQAAAKTREAGKLWTAEPAANRASALTAAAAAVEREATRFEDLIVQEVGKPRLEARGEVARSLAILRYYAQQIYDPIGQTYPPSTSGLLYTRRRPRGVAGLITPWNFPLAIPLWKAAPALAAGNGVLLKPSSAAIACALLLEEILAEVLPEHLLTVLAGERETATAMLAEVDVVSFTGSAAVGHSVAIAAATAGIEVQAEMGGQNAAIVFPSADVTATARMLIGAAMGYAGQKCTATRRIVTVGDARELSEALHAGLQTLGPVRPNRDDDGCRPGHQ